jgi:nitronate monooxygenase
MPTTDRAVLPPILGRAAAVVDLAYRHTGTVPLGDDQFTIGHPRTQVLFAQRLDPPAASEKTVHMPLRSTVTTMLDIEHPIVQAPMGGSAGGILAAAVSNAGGLGLIGVGSGDVGWMDREVALVAAGTSRPWGIGFQSWATDLATVKRALEHEPTAVMLSFGDPTTLAGVIRESDARLIVQVVDITEARRALDVGADVIVAQGTEAGGHGGTRATLPFVPAVVDLVHPIPVLAAGGIADGRGLAAALCLGAAGALVGTRFQASREALVDAEVVKAILDGRGEDTERSRVLDIVRGSAWPARYTGRTLRNEFLDEWLNREAELEGNKEVIASYSKAEREGDMRAVAVWAGEAIDLITDSQSAGEIVHHMATDAEAILRRTLTAP